MHLTVHHDYGVCFVGLEFVHSSSDSADCTLNVSINRWDMRFFCFRGRNDESAKTTLRSTVQNDELMGRRIVVVAFPSAGRPILDNILVFCIVIHRQTNLSCSDCRQDLAGISMHFRGRLRFP